MKVSKIEIKDFHQFKDLTIDLTYPKGHSKEGRPLDKVCFIGQSGTGKTTLLELISTFIYIHKTRFYKEIKSNKIENNIYIHIEFYSSTFFGAKIYNGNSSDESFNFLPDNNHNEKRFIEAYEQTLNGIDMKVIYLPSNLKYNFSDATSIIYKEIIDFSLDDISSIWDLILEKVQSYQEHELKIRQDISKIVEQSSNNLEVIKNALKKLEDWKASEFNPIKDIADKCLDVLLKPFSLKVKTELDFKGKEDLGFIKIEDFSGNEIPHDVWSTGTKQVILSAMPLYLLKPNRTIILFDEPERSLYPDMQRMIVDYYSAFAVDSQFFYATHSPIIASSFEPWEIVELKFNKEGKVYRELYYEGENHIDNYKWNPKYMRWDDILQRVFDMADDGSPERKKKLGELATCNVKYRNLKNDGKEDSEEARALLVQIDKLSKLLSKWN